MRRSEAERQRLRRENEKLKDELEAARRAVNAILARDRAGDAPCELWPMVESPIFDRAKRFDQILFATGVRKPGAEVMEELWKEEPGPGASFDDVRRLQDRIEQLPLVSLHGDVP